jgi:hypothetical protein
MKQQLIITIEDNKVGFSTNGAMSYSLITDVLGTVQLAAFRNALDQAPQELHPQLIDRLHQHYNQTASNILDEMKPDGLRPDITAEAIYNLENELLVQKAKLKGGKKIGRRSKHISST